jgi:hypothetical protein
MTVWRRKSLRLCQRSDAADLKAFGLGGKGIRTPGLLIANETLYQLSYTPGQRNENICSPNGRQQSVKLLTISAKPDGVGAVSQPWIETSIAEIATPREPALVRV